MLKRHVDQVWSRLDSLYANGITFVTWGELYHWYGVQRISKTPWRDLQAKWQSLLEEKGEEYCDPRISEQPGGIAFFFARSPGKLSKLAA